MKESMGPNVNLAMIQNYRFHLTERVVISKNVKKVEFLTSKVNVFPVQHTGNQTKHKTNAFYQVAKMNSIRLLTLMDLAELVKIMNMQSMQEQTKRNKESTSAQENIVSTMI